MLSVNTGRFANEQNGLYTVFIGESANDVDSLLQTTKHYTDPSELHLIKRYSKVEFLHVCFPEYNTEDNILENGLTHIETDYVGDLGIGIYAVDTNNLNGVENLKNYLENIDEGNVLVVTGEYIGKYYECITKGDHNGYILIDAPIAPNYINEVRLSTVSDFIMYY